MLSNVRSVPEEFDFYPFISRLIKIIFKKIRSCPIRLRTLKVLTAIYPLFLISDPFSTENFIGPFSIRRKTLRGFMLTLKVFHSSPFF